jgi:two-component system NtrC family sensor kinase
MVLRQLEFEIRRGAISAISAAKEVRTRSINLSFKLTFCLIGGMVLIFSALGYKVITLHRENLEEATYAAGDRITETITRSTRYGMLHNLSDQTNEIVASIRTQPGIEKVSIFNKAGVIKFSTDESEISTRVDKNAEACRACHVREGKHSQPAATIPHQLSRDERTRIFVAANGHRTLSVIDPIENEASCSTAACHAHSPEMKVLGMINVRMSLESVDQAIATSRRQMVVSLVAAITLLSMVFATLIWAMVHKPVHRLIEGTERVAAGDLNHKINIESHDELGNLARSFNRMTGELRRANAEINDWTKTLEDRVANKTAELRRAQEHVSRVEKLASIGKLAAIVAHENNNPLAGILVYARLLLKRLDKSNPGPATDEEKKHLETIAAESARCGEIVKGLLQFARQSKPNAEPNDLNDIIQQSLRLVRHKLELMNVRTEVDLDPGLPAVVCDAQQMKQALVALLINACEAVHDVGGVIAVETRFLADTNATEIRIRDNGVGMDEETRKFVFEPFFTTKEQGKGVGLGLAVVYGIVTGHGGDIEVESELGSGTIFVIRLPGSRSEVRSQTSEDRNRMSESQGSEVRSRKLAIGGT